MFCVNSSRICCFAEYQFGRSTRATSALFSIFNRLDHSLSGEIMNFYVPDKGHSWLLNWRNSNFDREFTVVSLFSDRNSQRTNGFMYDRLISCWMLRWWTVNCRALSLSTRNSYENSQPYARKAHVKHYSYFYRLADTDLVRIATLFFVPFIFNKKCLFIAVCSCAVSFNWILFASILQASRENKLIRHSHQHEWFAFWYWCFSI